MPLDPFPLPVRLTIGEAGVIYLGDVLVDVEHGPAGGDGPISVRTVDGRPLGAHVAELLAAQAERMRDRPVLPSETPEGRFDHAAPA